MVTRLLGVVPQLPKPRCGCEIVGYHGAPLAESPQVLARVERKARQIPVGTDRPPEQLSPMSLTSVVNQRQTAGYGQLTQDIQSLGFP